LYGIVAHPQQPIAELPLLTEVEMHRVLRQWNETETDYPRDRCVHELFENQVGRRPEAVAVIFESRSLTYGELSAKAGELASHLQEYGVGRNVLIGLCVERSPEMLVGILGILKAGAAYLPLDPSHPKKRLDFILQDAGVTVLVTQSDVLS